MFSRELNAINDVKHDKQKCNRIIDEGGMDLVYCICDCVHNILQGNIPVTDEEKDRLKRHRHCLRELVNEKTSYKKRKATHTGGRIFRDSNPYTRRISRKTVHWTIMDEMDTKL